jgi:hypothetical protein
MNVKRNIQQLVRGWIPKEPNVPKSQMKAATPAKIHPMNIWNPLWIIPLCITLIFFTINYFLFYIPLISTVIAVSIIDIAVVLSIARKQKNRIKTVTLGWVPKEPTLPIHSIANPEIKFRQKIQLPKGRILITVGWIVLSAVNLLRGDATGVLFLWTASIWGVALALDAWVQLGKELNPKLAVALQLAVISLGGTLVTLIVFSVPSTFLLRALSLGLLMVVHVPLLFAVVAYVWGKKDLSKKLLNWFAPRRD